MIPPFARELLARRRRAVTVFAVLGPGVIAANAGNDAGGIATYASAGSQFVYRTLFLMVLVTVALVVVQEMSARLGAYSGEGLVSLIREQFSLRIATVAVVCLVVANVGLVVSEFAGIGAAFELFGVSRYVAVPIAAVCIWSVVVLGTYRYAERVFLLLSVAFLAYPVAVFLGKPDWGQVATNTLWPHFTGSHAFVVLAVALVGTTITPYMQLYQAAAVADRGIGPDDYPRERLDSVGGAIFANVISMFIIIATAAAIGGHGALGSADEAARALEPVAGGGATILFGVGLLGASALAAAVVPLSTAYGLAEAVGAERSVSRRISEARLFVGLFTAQVVLGAAVALIPGNLITLLINTQILNGLITPVILAFILVLANRRSVLGDAVNAPRFRVVATVSVVAVSALALFVVAQTVFGWLGLA
ncbi:MAG TPA: divalent metal cation transporter [Acidimicrobiia bacterium]|jgi:NRAMP (natural resistance-associated macrophage protein)-like metal ion transporter|nr:divalent metal cation transporter [Acidimicrobiia bacterium]